MEVGAKCEVRGSGSSSWREGTVESVDEDNDNTVSVTTEAGATESAVAADVRPRPPAAAEDFADDLSAGAQASLALTLTLSLTLTRAVLRPAASATTLCVPTPRRQVEGGEFGVRGFGVRVRVRNLAGLLSAHAQVDVEVQVETLPPALASPLVAPAAPINPSSTF